MKFGNYSIKLNINYDIMEIYFGIISVFIISILKKFKVNSFVKKFLILLKIIIFADYNFNVVNY